MQEFTLELGIALGKPFILFFLPQVKRKGWIDVTFGHSGLDFWT